ncbi:MAG: L,D-transpeptidase, partial [Nitrospinae bacterium]|nr:L,D-transpeptidase [Nitrospinota bacterium]
RLSNNVKRLIKLTASAVSVFILAGLFVYQFVLNAVAQQKVDVAYYAGLNKIGLMSKEGLDEIQHNLLAATTKLEETEQEYQQLNQMVERMIQNNKVTENLKYILKQIHNDPRTRYVTVGKKVILKFNGKEIARYKSDPELWYVLGIVETGVMRIYYDDSEILEIAAIFGRTGEETPVGEYEIKNRAFKPTWYKKEKINNRTRVRAIPFGDPEHEIGHWWLGMRKLGTPISGSYGIHGVNASKVNDFYKKNFDWRNGSAGCPNIQEWHLHFLGKVLPLGTKVNIVSKDKWKKSPNIVQTASAA